MTIDLNRYAGTYGGYTPTSRTYCKHLNGWYIVVRFWVFKKRLFVCSDCGHHHEEKKS